MVSFDLCSARELVSFLNPRAAIFIKFGTFSAIISSNILSCSNLPWIQLYRCNIAWYLSAFLYLFSLLWIVSLDLSSSLLIFSIIYYFAHSVNSSFRYWLFQTNFYLIGFYSLNFSTKMPYFFLSLYPFLNLLTYISGHVKSVVVNFSNVHL